MNLVTALNATVVERSRPMGDAVELVLHHPEAATSVQPGQFFQLEVEAQHTLLRRPYSVAWADRQSGRIGFLFSVVGDGSAWLAAREAGQKVGVLGPLGNGFALPADPRPAVCLTGGLGIAPFLALVARLVELGRSVTVLAGARSSDYLLPASRFRGVRLWQATDDGSAGHHGPVTDLLAEVLREEPDIFACGPTPMLQTAMGLAERAGFPTHRIQVALETPMGCGVGTCLGCAAPRAGGGFLLACQDGPCLRADRLDWERMTSEFHD